MAKALSLVAYNDLESQVEALERDGYVYFPGVLDAEEVAQLQTTMDRLQAIPECLDTHQTPQNGGKFLNKIINNSFNRDPLFLQFLDKSPIVEVAEATHGEDCHCIGMQLWLTGPGRPDQGLHTDWLPVPLPADIRSDPRRQNPNLHHHCPLLSQRYVRRIGTDEVCPGQPFLRLLSKRSN